YAQRLLQRAPDDVRVNRATAQALRPPAPGATAPPGAGAEDELARLARRDTRAGRAAGYNLGTLLGGRKQYDPSLAALREVLERDPSDQDARWNYELVLRRKRDEANASRNPQQPQPKPQSGGGGGGGSPPPQGGPAGTANPTPPGPPSPAPEAPSMQRQGRMTREQADRLLGALQDLERIEQERRRQVRVTRERHGRDW
ncbi:MAG TPA: hypothetical protein VI792_10020, partial [Candidatus Eisenbacteria bacterium]